VTVQDAAGQTYQIQVKSKVPWLAKNGGGFDSSVMSCPKIGREALRRRTAVRATVFPGSVDIKTLVDSPEVELDRCPAVGRPIGLGAHRWIGHRADMVASRLESERTSLRSSVHAVRPPDSNFSGENPVGRADVEGAAVALLDPATLPILVCSACDSTTLQCRRRHLLQAPQSLPRSSREGRDRSHRLPPEPF
jgi:hypothetical protein